MSWLAQQVTAFVENPPVGPAGQQGAGLLYAAEAALLLDLEPLATQARAAAWQRLQQLPLGVEAARLAAQGMRTTPQARKRRRWVEAALRAAQSLTVPSQAAAAWEAIVRVAAQSRVRRAWQAALEAWPGLREDPWAQLQVWQALMAGREAWRRRAPSSWDALLEMLTVLPETHIVQALLWLHEQPWAKSGLPRPALAALAQRLERSPDLYPRARGLVALGRWFPVAQRKAWAQQATEAAQALTDEPYRTEALAWAALGWAQARAASEARALADQVLAALPQVGYMDDRLRVLAPLLKTFTTLRRTKDLERVWPWVADIGYPRFLGPAVAAWIDAAKQLRASYLVQRGLRLLLNQARETPAEWQRIPLLQAFLRPAMSPEWWHAAWQEVVMPTRTPRYRAQGLVLLAENPPLVFPSSSVEQMLKMSPWDLVDLQLPWETLAEQARDIPAPAAREFALHRVLLAWLVFRPQEGLEAGRAFWPWVTAPHRRGELLATAVRTALRLAFVQQFDRRATRGET